MASLSKAAWSLKSQTLKSALVSRPKPSRVAWRLILVESVARPALGPKVAWQLQATQIMSRQVQDSDVITKAAEDSTGIMELTDLVVERTIMIVMRLLRMSVFRLRFQALGSSLRVVLKEKKI